MNSSGTAVGADISTALRELLLLRAAGKITADEFDMRQAGLHALLLTAPADADPPQVQSPQVQSPQVQSPQVQSPQAQSPDAIATDALSTPRPVVDQPSAARGGITRPFPRKLLLVTICSVAVFAVGMYFVIGNTGNVSTLSAPPAAKETAGAGPVVAQPPPGKAGGDLSVMVKRLADKMAADPKNGEGWLLLARTYAELQMPRESAEAYAKAAALLPADAAMLADWATVNVAANGGKWDDPSRDILKRALSTDPKHMKSLALAGLEATERADRGKATEYWERLKKVAPADSPDAKMAESKLAEMRAGTGGKAAAGTDAAPKSAPAKKSAP